MLEMSEYLFLRGGFIQTSTIVCSRKIASQIMFDTRFKRHQDYDFCIRAYYSGLSFEYCDVPLTTYKLRDSSFNSNNESVSYCSWWLETMKPFMSKDGYYGYMLFSLTNRYIQEKRFFSAFKNAIFSIFFLGPASIVKSYPKIKYLVKRKFGDNS
jgi:amylovoran biosynthesis glycosyltransferase AmsB